MLGDLNEDFTALLRREGRRPAHRWYWTQSIPLAFSALAWRALGRPIVRNTQRGDGTMGKAFSSNGLVQDAAYALRVMGRDRGFFALATIIIGLGVAPARQSSA